jgi:hypothetical protein
MLVASLSFSSSVRSRWSTSARSSCCACWLDEDTSSAFSAAPRSSAASTSTRSMRAPMPAWLPRSSVSAWSSLPCSSASLRSASASFSSSVKLPASRSTARSC